MDEWVDESELPALDRAKLVALRICTHRVLGFARADDKIDIAKPVMKMLSSIVYRAGTVNESTQEG